MSASRARSGFTLIELLIVVVIIGILAAIVVPKFKESKGKAYAAGLKSDLKNVVGLQEAYYYSNNRYSSSLGPLNFTGTNGVQISIVSGDAGGWAAVATHPAAWPLTCAVFYGNASPVAPATNEGMINCQ